MVPSVEPPDDEDDAPPPYRPSPPSTIGITGFDLPAPSSRPTTRPYWFDLPPPSLRPITRPYAGINIVSDLLAVGSSATDHLRTQQRRPGWLEVDIRRPSPLCNPMRMGDRSNADRNFVCDWFDEYFATPAPEVDAFIIQWNNHRGDIDLRVLDN